MSKPEPGFNWDEIDALRDESRLAECDDPGFTAKEYADRYGLVYQTAVGQLRVLSQAGKLVRGKRHVSSGGARRLVSVYRPAGMV